MKFYQEKTNIDAFKKSRYSFCRSTLKSQGFDPLVIDPELMGDEDCKKKINEILNLTSVEFRLVDFFQKSGSFHASYSTEIGSITLSTDSIYLLDVFYVVASVNAFLSESQNDDFIGILPASEDVFLLVLAQSPQKVLKGKFYPLYFTNFPFFRRDLGRMPKSICNAIKVECEYLNISDLEIELKEIVEAYNEHLPTNESMVFIDRVDVVMSRFNEYLLVFINYNEVCQIEVKSNYLLLNQGVYENLFLAAVLNTHEVLVSCDNTNIEMLDLKKTLMGALFNGQ